MCRDLKELVADYKYDLALSLLDEDETTAEELCRLLPESVNPFLYSKRELELTGRDGVEAFAAVFGREARTVAVLHRQGWGGTKWTAIEADAVRGRLWNKGPDFLTLVKLDTALPPEWFPTTRVWADFERLGLEGVAAVLAERVRASGGFVRDETAEELAVRMRREQDADVRRRGFLASPEGVQESRRAAGEILNELERLGPAIEAEVTRVPWTAMLFRNRHSVTVAWGLPWTNTLDDSTLCVKVWRGRPDVGGQFAGEKKELDVSLFDFDQPATGQVAWRRRETGQLFSSTQLADWAARLLLAKVRPAIR